MSLISVPVRLYFFRIFASGTLIRKRYAYFFCNFLVVWYSYYNPVRLLGFFLAGNARRDILAPGMRYGVKKKPRKTRNKNNTKCCFIQLDAKQTLRTGLDTGPAARGAAQRRFDIRHELTKLGHTRSRPRSLAGNRSIDFIQRREEHSLKLLFRSRNSLPAHSAFLVDRNRKCQ